jgi:hypothetical protein
MALDLFNKRREDHRLDHHETDHNEAGHNTENVTRRERARDNDIEERSHAVVNEELQHNRFGGFHFGPAFFGWLVASGLGAMILTLLTAAGASVAVAKLGNVTGLDNETAQTVGLVGGILLAVVLTATYYAGGYVAGRMARFDGARQGFGVWLVGLIVALVLGILAATLGAKYNVLSQLNLPHIPVNGTTFTTGGLIATLITLGLTLLGAVLGGKQGERFHRRVDDAGTIEHMVFARRQAHSH